MDVPHGLQNGIGCGVLSQNHIQGIAVPCRTYHIGTDDGDVGDIDNIGFGKVGCRTHRGRSSQNRLDHECTGGGAVGTQRQVSVIVQVHAVTIAQIITRVGIGNSIYSAVDIIANHQRVDGIDVCKEAVVLGCGQGQGILLTGSQAHLHIIVVGVGIPDAAVDLAGVAGQIDGQNNIGVGVSNLGNALHGDVQIFGDGSHGDLAGLGGDHFAVDLHGKVLGGLKALIDGNVELVAVGSNCFTCYCVANTLGQGCEVLTLTQIVSKHKCVVNTHVTVCQIDSAELIGVFGIGDVQQLDGTETVGCSLFHLQADDGLAVAGGLTVAVLLNIRIVHHISPGISELVNINIALVIGDVDLGGALGNLYLVELAHVIVGFVAHVCDGDGLTVGGNDLQERCALGDDGEGCAADRAGAVHIGVAGSGGTLGNVGIVACLTGVGGVAALSTGGRSHDGFIVVDVGHFANIEVDGVGLGGEQNIQFTGTGGEFYIAGSCTIHQSRTYNTISNTFNSINLDD